MSMSTILSLPEELIIEIMAKGDYKMLLTCQRVSERSYILCISSGSHTAQVCRTLNSIITDSVPLQYIITLAACGMLDGPSPAVYYERTAERLRRLREHEAAWRQVAWSDGSMISHMAARELPTTSSGGVLAFLKQSDGDSGDTEYGDRLFLLRVPSRLRGIPGESWELNDLGEMSNVCIDSAQDLLLFQRCVPKTPTRVTGQVIIPYLTLTDLTIFTCECCRLEKSTHQFIMRVHLICK